MRREYQFVGGKERGRVPDKEKKQVKAFFAANGQALLPLVKLIEDAKLAMGELIQVSGRAVAGTVFLMSVERLIGPPPQGKPGAEIVRDGSQAGVVMFLNRKLKVEQLRLRRKGAGQDGEMKAPA